MYIYIYVCVDYPQLYVGHMCFSCSPGPTGCQEANGSNDIEEVKVEEVKEVRKQYGELVTEILQTLDIAYIYIILYFIILYYIIL